MSRSRFEPWTSRIRAYGVFLIGIVGGGVQLGQLGTAATNRPTVPAPGDYDDGEIGGMIGRGNSLHCYHCANPLSRYHFKRLVKTTNVLHPFKESGSTVLIHICINYSRFPSFLWFLTYEVKSFQAANVASSSRPPVFPSSPLWPRSTTIKHLSQRWLSLPSLTWTE
jgi:hypothetical protein